MSASQQPLPATRAAERSVWRPVVLAATYLLLLAVLPWAKFLPVWFGVLWWLASIAALLVAGPAFLISFAIALARQQWRRASARAAATLIFLAAYPVVVGYNREPAWSAVSSPSGAATISKTYSSEAEQYTVDISRRGWWRRSRRLLSAATPDQVLGVDNVLFAWNDDRHLVVAAPGGPGAATRHDKVDDIDIDYVVYEPDLDRSAATDAQHGVLRNVYYSFEEIDGRDGAYPRVTRCVIHITAIDGTVYDRIAVDIIGYGIGLSTDQYKSFGGVKIRFGLSKRPDGTSPSLTLTQAKLGTVFPTAPVQTRQQDLSLYYSMYSYSDAVDLFSLLWRGDFDIKFALGFDGLRLVYRVAEPIPPGVVDQFLACSAKTNIYGVPFILPRH